MRKNFCELRGRKKILDNYRAFRRGVITLPQLERDLERDLTKLNRFIEAHRESKLQEGFIELGIQVLETTKDVVEETIRGVDTLMDYVATSEHVMNPTEHRKYVSENIMDEEARQLILNTLSINGGTEELLSTTHGFLLSKELAYSKSIRAAKRRSSDSWKSAYEIITDHYKGELETLIDYWKRRLKEEKKAYEGQVYFSQVEYELCQRYPDIAKQLGIDCPEHIWPIILIAVFCAVMCEGD